DHQASSTIEEFSKLVESIRKVEKILGVAEKLFSKEEIDIALFARKSIVSKRKISKGSKIKNEDICYKRPGTGFLPIEKDQVIGKKALINIPKNKVITRDFLIDD
ncbi:MAG: SAF domain-containing protein, partial [SAR202 cluster bacterium]|nr:SAF domain-containing protein [SAR202 cluster bacterium]